MYGNIAESFNSRFSQNYFGLGVTIRRSNELDYLLLSE